jgi:hypothetical protein
MRAGGGVQGKAGEKKAVGFQVTNHGKVAVTVVVRVGVRGSTAQIESAESCNVAATGTAATCQLKAGGSATGSIQILLRTAGESEGSITASIAGQQATDPKPGNNVDTFKVRVTGASASPSKSTRASRSATAEPTGGASDEVIAPPEAGNGAIPQDEANKTPVKDESGLSFGFWVGVVAILAALGLVGSLFYFRRKDRLEPDTGVFHLPNAGHDNPTSVITPGVYGSPPPPPAFQGGSNVYGAPPAPAPPPPAFPPPSFPPPSFPPPAGPPGMSPPGANDQTILMRRPDDL